MIERAHGNLLTIGLPRHKFGDFAAPESGNGGRLACLAQLLRRKLTLLTQMYRALNSPDLVKMIDHQLAESREDRLAATDIGLPPIFLGGVLAISK